MNKTILIGTNNKFSSKANRWFFSLFGLLFLANGAFNIYSDTTKPLKLILGVLMIFGGLFCGAYGLLGFSKKSRFALKVKIDDETIEIKYSLLKPPMLLNWSAIQAITFGQHEVGFDLGSITKLFSYRANEETSRNIKQAIRDMAESKNIPVTSR